MHQYYRPWDLLPDEETRIEDQLEEARTRVDEELAKFEIEKEKRLATLDGTSIDERPRDDQEPSQTQTAEAAPGESEKSTNVDLADSEPASNTADSNGRSTNEGESSEAVAADVAEIEGKADEIVETSDDKKEEAEDDGDHIVEGDEDNVIY